MAFNLTANLNVALNTGSLRSAVNQVNSSFNNASKLKLGVDRGSFADIGRVKAQVMEATDSMQQFGYQAGLAAKRFAAFTVTAGSVITLTQTMREAVSAAIDFDREMVRLAQVSNDSSAGVQSVANEITRLSTNFGVSSKDLLNVAITLKQANLSLKDTKIALEAMAQAALAPNFDNLKSTTEGAIAIMNQFGVAAKDLGGALGSVNVVAGEFAVEAGDIIEAVRKTGGAFKAAGGNLNELIALFTAVRQTTRESAETIGTGLRTIFTRIQRNDTAEALKQVGIQLRYTRQEALGLGDANLENQFVGPYEAIRRLAQGLEQLRGTDPRFSAIVEQLGGYRQISKVIPLIKEFGIAQKALGIAQAGQASLALNAAQAQDALAIKLTKLKEQFLEVGRGIVNSPGFRSLVDVFITASGAVLKLIDSLKGMLPLIAALGAIKIGKSLAGLTSGFLKGVSTGDAKKASGGFIRMKRGGVVPGSGNGDIVPALLEPGEVVIPRQKFQEAGIVKSSKYKTQFQFSHIGPSFKKGKTRYYQNVGILMPSAINNAWGKNIKLRISNKDLITHIQTQDIFEAYKKNLRKYEKYKIGKNVREHFSNTENENKYKQILIDSIKKNNIGYFDSDEQLTKFLLPAIAKIRKSGGQPLQNIGNVVAQRTVGKAGRKSGRIAVPETSKYYNKNIFDDKINANLGGPIQKLAFGGFGKKLKNFATANPFKEFDNVVGKAKSQSAMAASMGGMTLGALSGGFSPIIASTILGLDPTDFSVAGDFGLIAASMLSLGAGALRGGILGGKLGNALPNMLKKVKGFGKGILDSKAAENFKNLSSVESASGSGITFKELMGMAGSRLKSLKNKIYLGGLGLAGAIGAGSAIASVHGGFDPVTSAGLAAASATLMGSSLALTEKLLWPGKDYSKEEIEAIEKMLKNAKEASTRKSMLNELDRLENQSGLSSEAREVFAGVRRRVNEESQISPKDEKKAQRILQAARRRKNSPKPVKSTPVTPPTPPTPTKPVVTPTDETKKPKYTLAQAREIAAQHLRDNPNKQFVKFRFAGQQYNLARKAKPIVSPSVPSAPMSREERKAQATRELAERTAANVRKKEENRRLYEQQRRDRVISQANQEDLRRSLSSRNLQDGIGFNAQATSATNPLAARIAESQKYYRTLAETVTKKEEAIPQFSFLNEKPITVGRKRGQTTYGLMEDRPKKLEDIGIYGLVKETASTASTIKTEVEKLRKIKKEVGNPYKPQVGSTQMELFPKGNETRPDIAAKRNELLARRKKTEAAPNDEAEKRRKAAEIAIKNQMALGLDIRSIQKERYGFASGGLVPGVGNSDTVPMNLPEGSFVIRKSSVNKIGADRLAKMGRYASGGSVPSLLTPGEYVFSPKEASRIGASKLHSMNKFAKFAEGGNVSKILSSADFNSPDQMKKIFKQLIRQIINENPTISRGDAISKAKSVMVDIKAQADKVSTAATQTQNLQKAYSSAEKGLEQAQTAFQVSSDKLKTLNANLNSLQQQSSRLANAQANAASQIAANNAKLGVENARLIAAKAKEAAATTPVQRTKAAADRAKIEADILRLNQENAQNLRVVNAASKQQAALASQITQAQADVKQQQADVAGRQQTVTSRTARRDTAKKAFEQGIEDVAKAQKDFQYDTDETGNVTRKGRIVGTKKPMRGPGTFDFQTKEEIGNIQGTFGIRGNAAKGLAKQKIADQYQTAIYQQLKSRAEQLGKQLDEAELQAAAQDYTEQFQKGRRKAIIKDGKVVGDVGIGQKLSKDSSRFFGYKETGEAKLGTRLLSGAKGLATQFGPAAVAIGANFLAGQMRSNAPTAESIVKSGVGGTVDVNQGRADELKSTLQFAGTIEKAANYATAAGSALAVFGPVVAGIGAGFAGLVGGIEGFIEGTKEAEKQIREAKIASALENLQGVFDRVSTGLEDVNDSTASIISNNQKIISEGTGARAFEAAGGDKTLLSSIGSVITGGYAGVNVQELNTQLRREEQQSLATQVVPLTNVLNRFAEQIGKQAVTDVRVGGGDVANLNFEDLRKQLTDSFKNQNNAFAKEQVTKIALAKNISLEQAEKEFVKVIQESFNAEKLKQVGLKAVAANERTITSMQALSNAVNAAAFSSDRFSSRLETNTDLFEGRISAFKIPNLADQFSSGTPDLNAFNSAISDASNALGVFGKQFREQGNAVNVASQTLPEILAGAVANPISGQDVSTQIADGLRAALSQRGITGAAADTVVSSVAGAASGQDYEKLLAEAGGDVGKLSQKLLSGISEPLMQAFKDISAKTNEAANQYIQGLTELANRQRQLIDSYGKLDSLQLQSQKFRAKETARAIGLPSQAEEFTSYAQMTQGFRNRQQRLTGFGAGAAEDPQAIANRLRATQQAIRAQEEKVKTTSTTTNAGADFRDASQELVKLKSEATNLQEALKNLTDQSEKVTAAEQKLEKIRSDRDIERSFGRKLLTANPEEQLKIAQGQQLANIAQAQGGNISNFGLEARQVLFDFLDNFGPVGKDVADKIVENTTGLGKSRGNEEKQLVMELSKIYADQENAQQLLIQNQESLQKDYFSNLDSRNQQFYSELQRFTNELQKSQMVAERGREQQKLAKIEDVQKNAKFLGDAGITSKEQLQTVVSKRGEIQALAQSESRIKRSEDSAAKAAGMNFQNIAKLAPDTKTAAINNQKIIAELTNVFGDPSLARSIADQFRTNLESGLGSADAIRTAAISVTSSQVTTEKSNYEKLSSGLGQGEMADKIRKIASSISSGNIDEAQFLRAIDGIKELNLGVGQDLTQAASDAKSRVDELNTSINNLGGIQPVKPQVQAAQLASGGSIFKPKGTDTVPAMLTPGEFVVNRKSAQQNLPLLRSINSGTNYLSKGGSVGYYENGAVVDNQQKLDDNTQKLVENLIEQGNNLNTLKSQDSWYKTYRQQGFRESSDQIIDTIASEKKDQILKTFNDKFLTLSADYAKTIQNEGIVSAIQSKSFLDAKNAKEKSLFSEGNYDWTVIKRNLRRNITALEDDEKDSGLMDLARIGINTVGVTASAINPLNRIRSGWNWLVGNENGPSSAITGSYQIFLNANEFDGAFNQTKFAQHKNAIDLQASTYLKQVSPLSEKLKSMADNEIKLREQAALLAQDISDKPDEYIGGAVDLGLGTFGLSGFAGFIPGTPQNAKAKERMAQEQAKKDALKAEEERIKNLRKQNTIDMRSGALQSTKDRDARISSIKDNLIKSYLESGLINEDISDKSVNKFVSDSMKNQDKYFFQGKGSADALAKIFNQREMQAQVLVGRLKASEDGISADDISKLSATDLFQKGESELQKLVKGEVTGISLDTLNKMNADKKKVIASYISLKSFQMASLDQGKDLVSIIDKYGSALNKDKKVLVDKLIKEKAGRTDISGFKDFIIADADGKFNFLTLLNQTLKNQGATLTNQSIIKNKDKNVLDVLAAKDQKAYSFTRFGKLLDDGIDAESQGKVQFGSNIATVDFSETLFSSIIPSQGIQPLVMDGIPPKPETIEAFIQSRKDQLFDKDTGKFLLGSNISNAGQFWSLIDSTGQLNISRFKNLSFLDNIAAVSKKYGLFQGGMFKIESLGNKEEGFKRLATIALAENEPLLSINAAVLSYLRSRPKDVENVENKPEAVDDPNQLAQLKDAGKFNGELGGKFLRINDSFTDYLKKSFSLKAYKQIYDERDAVIADGDILKKNNGEGSLGFSIGNYWLAHDLKSSNRPVFDKSSLTSSAEFGVYNNADPGYQNLLNIFTNPADFDLPNQWNLFADKAQNGINLSFPFDQRDASVVDAFNNINNRAKQFLKFQGVALGENSEVVEENLINNELDNFEKLLLSKHKVLDVINKIFNETIAGVNAEGIINYNNFKERYAHLLVGNQQQQMQEPQMQSRGGLINYLAGGGVPSYAPNPDRSFFKPKGTDTVPAMLSPGEFVVRKSAAQANLPLLQAINSGNYLANGGQVSYYATGGSAGVIANNNLLQSNYDYTKRILSNVDSKSKLSKNVSDITKTKDQIKKLSDNLDTYYLTLSANDFYLAADTTTIIQKINELQLKLVALGGGLGVALASGGLVPNLGFFAGGGSVDTVPAMLTPGEFVVNKNAASKHLSLLKKINNNVSYKQNGGILDQYLQQQSQMLGLDPISSFEQRYRIRTGANQQALENERIKKEQDRLEQEYFMIKRQQQIDSEIKQREKENKKERKIPQLSGKVRIGTEAIANLKPQQKPQQKFQPTKEQLNAFYNNPESLSPSEYIQIKRSLSSPQNKAGGGLIQYKNIGGELAFGGYKTQKERMQELEDYYKELRLSRNLAAAGPYSLSRYYFRPEEYSRDVKSATDFAVKASGGSNPFMLGQQRSSTSFGVDDDASRGQQAAFQAGMEGAEKSGVLSMTNAELEGRQKYISEQAEKRNELLDAVASQLGIQRVRLASGGSVPGFGNGDTVPALLTPGEFVINKNAVSKFGINNLEHINRYANGGVVSYFRRGTNNAISAGSTSYAMPNIDFQQFESGVNLFNEAVSSFNENSGSFSEIISNFNANILESSNLLDSTLSNFVSGMSEVSASLDAVITKIPSTFTHDHNFGGNLAVSIQADIQTAVNDIIASFQQEVAMAMEQLRGAGM